MWDFGSTSHRTRNTSRIASCVARIVKRPRRSRANHSRYCGLGPPTVVGGTKPMVSAFDMDFELPPQSVEVAVELGRVACGERRRAAAIRPGKADLVLRLHPSGPA